MEKFDSITHFLQSGDFDYQIFDMGRKVMQLSNGDFQQIENQEKAYPYPFQKKAWLALIFWPSNAENKKEPTIWFLQFPVDEMGFLKQDARDGFLIGLLEQAGKNIQAKQAGEDALDELSESPYAFKPQPDRLAMFHAFAMVALDRPPSRYYQATCEYLSGKLGYEQWQFLGLQGITDVVARLHQDENESLLSKAVPLMPQTPLESFCRALENVKPQGLLAQTLLSRLTLEVEAGQSQSVLLVSMLTRAISGVQPEKMRNEALVTVLTSSFGKEIEVLAAISGRAWNDLRAQSIISLFIANLAYQDQTAFDAILADLMMMPEMRQTVLEVMRSSERSTELSNKLNKFMENVKDK